MDFTYFIANILNIYAFILTGGYVAYKFGMVEAKTWEEGVKKFLTLGFHIIYKIYCFAYTELTGKEVSGNSVDVALILTDDEVLELVNTLDGHLYDTPALTGGQHNNNGIAYYNISAVGLTSHYEGMDNDQIAKIATHKIHNYYLRTRKRPADIHILVATPKRLYFAIPLSEEGRKSLEKQALDITTKNNAENRKPLTEEIKLPKDSDLGDAAHDSGIPKD